MRLLDHAFEERPDDVRCNSQLPMTAAKADFLFFRNCTYALFLFSIFLYVRMIISTLLVKYWKACFL